MSSAHYRDQRDEAQASLEAAEERIGQLVEEVEELEDDLRHERFRVKELEEELARRPSGPAIGWIQTSPHAFELPIRTAGDTMTF